MILWFQLLMRRFVHAFLLVVSFGSVLTSQTFQWSVKETHSGITAGSHLASDSLHQVVVVGSDWLSQSFDPNQGSFIHKYDKNGTVQWKYYLPKVMLPRVALRQADILLSGVDSVGGFIARYAGNGTLNSKNYIFMNDSTPYAYINGIGADAGDNYYVTGRFGRKHVINSKITLIPKDAGSFFLLKFNKYDSCLWAKTSDGGAFMGYPELRVDPAGNCYIGGTTYSLNIDGSNFSYPTPFALLLKYNTSGNMVFKKPGATKSNTPTFADHQDVTAVGFDQAGNFYYTGRFYGKLAFGIDTLTANDADIYVARINNDGSSGWMRHISDSLYADGGGLDVSANGNVYISGRFWQFCSFDSVYFLTGMIEPFIAKYNSSGQVQWAIKTDCSVPGSSGLGHGVSVDTDEHVFVTGRFEGQMNFGGWVKSSVGTSMFLTMINGEDGLGLTENRFSNDWRVFPNPVSGLLQVQLPPGTDKMILSNILGRQIFEIKTSESSQQLNLSSVDPGVYILTVSDGIHHQSKRLIVK